MIEFEVKRTGDHVVLKVGGIFENWENMSLHFPPDLAADIAIKLWEAAQDDPT